MPETGTNTCVICGKEFTDENPCCCDSGTYDDNTHKEGRCVACCRPTHPKHVIWDGKGAAGGIYIRC